MGPMKGPLRASVRLSVARSASSHSNPTPSRSAISIMTRGDAFPGQTTLCAKVSSQMESATQSARSYVTSSASAQGVQMEPNKEAEIMASAAVAAEPKAVVEPEAAVGEPIIEIAVAEPVVEASVTEPVAEVAAAEPVVEVAAAEPFEEVAASEPVAEVTAEPVLEAAAEQVVEAAAEPVVEAAAEPVVEAAAAEQPTPEVEAVTEDKTEPEPTNYWVFVAKKVRDWFR